MSRLIASLAALTAIALACAPTAQHPPAADGGQAGSDAGPALDAGVTSDAGLASDAGPALDAGPTGLGNCGSPPTADAGTVSALVQGNTQLAVDLFGQLAGQADGGNLFFSPFSISAALAMTYAGANGATATQMAKVLGLPASPQDLPPAFGALDCQLEGDAVSADGGQLDIANALFGQTGTAFEPTFLSLLQDDYGAPLQQVDFLGDINGAIDTIDRWVSHNTNGMIPKVLKPGDLSPSTVLTLANALYFDGLWAQQFDPSATQTGAFQVSSTQTVQVPLMAGSAPASSYIKGDGFALLELPYRSRTAMDLILPDAVDGLPALESQLTLASLQALLSQLPASDQGGKLVLIQLPKFKLDSRPDVQGALLSLGLTLPFSGGADFSGIDGAHDLFISKLIHEAVLQVDESGTMAAAVTIVGMGGSGAPSILASFDVTHPFLLLIRDLPTGSLLFVGQVTNPTAG